MKQNRDTFCHSTVKEDTMYAGCVYWSDTITTFRSVQFLFYLRLKFQMKHQPYI